MSTVTLQLGVQEKASLLFTPEIQYAPQSGFLIFQDAQELLTDSFHYLSVNSPKFHSYWK